MTPSDELLRALRDTFGHDHFRAGQQEIVQGVLAGRPTLAVMPTGAGKSLCYQLPATLLPGLTVVFSPLVALMKDQVDGLRRRGVEAAFLNSTQSEQERERVERDVLEGRVRLLFVAPERFRNPGFTRLLSKVRPELIAVDEAHCVCEWGDTFRPDYALLGEALQRLAPPRLLALTATAAPDVRADIVKALRLKDPVVKVAGFDRPNLHLEVHPLDTEAERQDTTAAAVLAHAPAIVYAATRKTTERLTRHLTRSGLAVRAYHAGLPVAERARTQEAFLDGRLQAVCATNAFGLGIDKPDVRLVLHAELPRSLDAWWQEAGRAGRDGAPAIAGLLYLKRDIFTRRRLLQMSTPTTAAVDRLARRLARAKAPMSREALTLALAMPWWDTASALAFMEAAGLVTRHWGQSGLTLRLKGRPDARGESTLARLAKVLGGTHGHVAVDDACRAMGVDGAEQLDQLLESLERAGNLERVRTPPGATYSLVAGASFGRDERRRLRLRSIREQARLRAMIDLAEAGACRRSAVLAAFGESSGKGGCAGCDVCLAARLTPVRSRRRQQSPRKAPSWRVSPPADNVPGHLDPH